MQKQPKQRTVVDKLKECKQICIQNLEKNVVQKNMVYMFLKNNKIDSDVRNITIYPKQGLVKIQFNDHDKAKNFYDTHNFKSIILSRTFNLYFGLQLTDAEMKKYYLEGITEQGQRNLFDAARKIGICKLYTSYVSTNRGKLKPNGVLSFIRKDQLTQSEFKSLEADLKAIGIKISPYVAEKDTKCSIKVTSFFAGKTDQEDEKIIAEGEAFLREKFGKIIDYPFTGVTINVRRKEGTDEVFVPGLLEFEDMDKTIASYEKIRKSIIEDKKMKVILYFHNDENNSYLSLFTSGLQMPKEYQEEIVKNPSSRIVNEKKFQDKLLSDFKLINDKVVQVNIYPVKRSGTYVGRVYLRSEEEGKNFIIDYIEKRDKIYKNYKDKNMIAFNINIDAKTFIKIKNAEKRVSNITKGIKMSDQAEKRNKRPNINKFGGIPGIPGNFMSGVPIGMMGGPIMPPGSGNMGNLGNMGLGSMGSGPERIMINPGNLGNIGAMNMGMGGSIPHPGLMPAIGQKATDYHAMAAKFIRDKQTLIKENAPQTVKKMIFPCLKHFIEIQQKTSPAESGIIAHKIVQLTDVAELIALLQDLKLLKAKIEKYK